MLSVLLPVIKPNLKNEFLSIWDKWFVTEDTVEDEKYPGKLKSKIYIKIWTEYLVNIHCKNIKSMFSQVNIY